MRYIAAASAANLPAYGSWEEREAREQHADVDRAMEVLGAEGGRIFGDVRDLRRRWDALLDELHPPPARPTLRRRWLHATGFGVRARAADAGLAVMFYGVPVGVRAIGIECGPSSAGTSPERCMRSLVARALDEAYRVLLPHEAARRTALQRRLWAASRDSTRGRP